MKAQPKSEPSNRKIFTLAVNFVGDQPEYASRLNGVIDDSWYFHCQSETERQLLYCEIRNVIGIYMESFRPGGSIPIFSVEQQHHTLVPWDNVSDRYESSPLTNSSSTGLPITDQEKRRKQDA